MKRILTALTLSVVLAFPSWSEPITLKCEGENYGTPQEWQMHFNLEEASSSAHRLHQQHTYINRNGENRCPEK